MNLAAPLEAEAVGGLRSFAQDLAAHRASARLRCPQNAPGVRSSLTRRGKQCTTCGGPRPKRPRRDRDTAAYGAMVLRIVTAYGRRVAAGDPEDLKGMLACYKAMGEMIGVAVRGARAELGWTWTDVGRAAGITKQSAHGRWGGVA